MITPWTEETLIKVKRELLENTPSRYGAWGQRTSMGRWFWMGYDGKLLAGIQKGTMSRAAWEAGKEYRHLIGREKK